MLVVLSGSGLRAELSLHVDLGRFEVREESNVSRAAWLFLRPLGPQAWIIAADCLDESGSSSVRALLQRRVPVSSILLFRNLDPGILRQAWSLAPSGLRVAFRPTEVAEFLGGLSDERAAVADFVIQRLRLADGMGQRLIRLLATERAALAEPAEQVAKRLNMSRATFFRHASEEQLPRLEDLQILFRLVACFASLREGAGIHTVSYSMGFSEASTLRKMFARKLGVTIAAALERDGYAWIVDAWLNVTVTRIRGSHERV